MFLTKEATRLAIDGTAVGAACAGCPPLPDLVKHFQTAAGPWCVCPICFNTRKLDQESLIAWAELNGTVPCGTGSATTAPPPLATSPGHLTGNLQIQSPRRSAPRT
jgi:hypothetical protein